MKKALYYFFLIGVPIIFVALGWNSIYWGIKSDHWPSVKGTIVKSKIIRRVPSFTGSKGVNAGRIIYILDLDYRYMVIEKEYHNSRIAYKRIPSSEIDVMIMQKKYLKDQEVDIFYCPNNPNRSVLIQGYDRMSILIIVVPICIWLVFLYVLRMNKTGSNTIPSSLSDALR